jgi:5'-3' exonuclease
MNPNSHNNIKQVKELFDGVLLIDVSSWIFWILFRLRNKFLYTKKLNPKFSHSLIEYIMANIHTYMTKSILQLKSTHKADLVVFARDSSRDTVWRLKRFDRYKTHRRNFIRHKGDNVDFSNFFTEIYSKVYDRIVTETGAIALKVTSTEADDIIAIVTKELVTKYEMRVTIIADDNDFYQLLELPNVEAYNLSGKSFRDVLKHILPKFYLRKKFLEGDRSDNIPACKLTENLSNLKLTNITLHDAQELIKIGMLRTRFITHEEVYELQSNAREIKIKLEADPIFREDYIRNIKLIDMKYIPIEIINNIMEIWNEKITAILKTFV